MTTMQITWLDISSSYSHSSLALPAIESCKQNDENTWSCVRATINSDIFLTTKELLDTQPDIIVSTLWLFNHEIVVKICSRIKVLLPNSIIILGGPEFNGNNEDFLRTNKFADCVLRGEGEREFHKWLECKLYDWSEINGLCYIDTNNQYIDNGKAKVEDFELLPAPEHSLFFNFKSPFVQIETSRGCFNSCAFCVSGSDKPVRSQSIEKIRARIEYVKEQGIKNIRILDRTFNYSTSRAIALLELFKEYEGMNFHLEIHPALLNEKVRTALATMPKGMLHLEAGMQSLSDSVLIECDRKGENEKAIEGVRFLCSLSNFETHTDLIAGLPHYTYNQIVKDIKTLSSLKAGEIQLELLKLLPGTKMRIESKIKGIKFATNPPYEVLETPHISLGELNKSRLLSKLIDKFYNAKGWQEITRRLINENSNFLDNFLEFMIESDLLEQPLSLEKRGSLLYHYCKTNHPKELQSISLEWIKNGMSLKREEAGGVVKTTELPANITLQKNMHYYILKGAKTYIIGFDRSKEHSAPILIEEINPSDAPPQTT